MIAVFSIRANLEHCSEAIHGPVVWAAMGMMHSTVYVFHELVNFQVQFNVLVIFYKVLHGTGLSYLRKQLSMIVSIYQIYWEEWMLSKSTQLNQITAWEI